LAFVLKKQPKQRQARIEMAKLLTARGQSGAARQLLESLVAEQGIEPEPHLLLARIYQVQGDREAGEREVARFLELTNAEQAKGGMSGNLGGTRARRYQSP
jgi:predicted Zn-dependent protease